MGTTGFLERVSELAPTPEEVEQNYGWRERFEDADQPREAVEISKTDDQLRALISEAAHELVLKFEVDGRTGYEQRYCRPCRPPDPSGITIGLGYDIGFVQADEFVRDWTGEIADADFARLAHLVGLKSAAARHNLDAVRDIVIPWEAAIKVYNNRTVPVHGRRTLVAFPGADALHPDAFGALFSLVYNRGPGLKGERRSEMLQIREAINDKRPEEIPHLIRAMKRLWGAEAPGLRKRRDAEAKLFERGLVAAEAARRVIPAAVAVAGAEGVPAASDLHESTRQRSADAHYPADEDGDARYTTDVDADETAQAPPRSQFEALPAWSQVRWVDDDGLSIDYRHLRPDDTQPLAEARFLFTAGDLELLIRANGFAPLAQRDRVIFGLRGALLDHDTASPGDRYAQLNRQSLRLKVCRPDHASFRCVIGVWNRATQMLSGFVASTVPNRGIVWHHSREGGAGNLLPTGCYRYVVGTHRRVHEGCLRQDEPIAVLRSRNNPVYDIADLWDPCSAEPAMDNIHPAFSDNAFGSAEFSSFGCQVIRGTDRGGTYTGEFAKFRDALGLARPGADNGVKFSYVLLTGQEAAIASNLRAQSKDTSHADVRDSLARLRQGSSGELVRRLQTALGQPVDGVFSAALRCHLVTVQRAHAGDTAGDGVFSPELDRLWGLGIFGEMVIAPTAPPIVVASAASSRESVRGGAPDTTDQRLAALYYELGRRADVAQRDPELLTTSVMPQYEAINKESWDRTAAIGKWVMAGLEQRAHALICGDGSSDVADRAKLQAAVGRAAGQGREAFIATLAGIITGWLLVPTIISRPVAELLYDRILSEAAGQFAGSIGDNVTLACRVWGQRLYDQAAPAGAAASGALPPAAAPGLPKSNEVSNTAPPVAATATMDGGNL